MHVAPSVSASIMNLKEMKQSHLNKMKIHPSTCFFFKSSQFSNKNHHLYNKNANVIIFTHVYLELSYTSIMNLSQHIKPHIIQKYDPFFQHISLEMLSLKIK